MDTPAGDMPGPPGNAQYLPSPRPVKPKQTCAQCRARKVRCDGRLDFCSNCERLGYACSFRPASDTSGLEPISSAAVTPMNHIKGRRAARACKECHSAKSRCSGGLPKCQRCASRGMECVYYPRAGSRRRQSHSASPRPEQLQSSVGTQDEEDVAMPGSSDLQMRSPDSITHSHLAAGVNKGYQQKYPLLTHERVTTAIRRYFEHLHCLPSLAFLHRPSIMRLYRAQEAEPFLIGAIVAVTSRLPGVAPEECSIGLRCAEMAEELLNKAITQLSIFCLQAMLLLMRFRLWTGSPCDSLIKMGHLARSAFLLRLNYETLRPSAFVQESRRRLMWAIYMLDVSLADGLMEYRACPIKAINLRLPCLEDDFELGAETSSEQVTQSETVPSNRVGIIGYYIRMVYFNDQILCYLKKLINLKSHANTEKDFFQFEEDLKIFQSRLPGHERFTERNLALRAYSPRLARFVMTHVWWHVCHCQLFRCLLPTIPETFSQRLFSILGEALVNEYQKKCLEHAVGAANIFSSLQEVDKEACVLDMDMAECAFKVSEILLLSSESTRAALGIDRAGILQHATTCLRFTESMLGLFPAIAPITSDLTYALHAFAQGEACFAPSTTQETSPRQAISKHSALYRASFVDDSHRLEIPGSSQDTAVSPETLSRRLVVQPTPLTEIGGQTVGIHTNFSGSYNIPRGPQEVFNWPETVPDIWDQLSLFRGPFDPGEIDSQGSGPG